MHKRPLNLSAFLKEPNQENLEILLTNVKTEYNDLEFKEQWPNKGNLSRSILAIANYGGVA